MRRDEKKTRELILAADGLLDDVGDDIDLSFRGRLGYAMALRALVKNHEELNDIYGFAEDARLMERTLRELVEKEELLYRVVQGARERLQKHLGEDEE